MEMLDLAATGCLSKATMATLMAKIFGSDPTRILGSANLVSVTLGTGVVLNRDSLETRFFGASMECAMMTANRNGNH
ncbi:hypothetical protein PInf_010374 [Phytophthora infestans]|nr:hypothetical protein PInf_010374 [Phytophthora infestans]